MISDPTSIRHDMIPNVQVDTAGLNMPCEILISFTSPMQKLPLPFIVEASPFPLVLSIAASFSPSSSSSSSHHLHLLRNCLQSPRCCLHQCEHTPHPSDSARIFRCRSIFDRAVTELGMASGGKLSNTSWFHSTVSYRWFIRHSMTTDSENPAEMIRHGSPEA